MLPRDLKASQFASYPPQARELAAGRVALLQQLPLGFLPLLLRELLFTTGNFHRSEVSWTISWRIWSRVLQRSGGSCWRALRICAFLPN